jgi:hypothetical protein
MTEDWKKNLSAGFAALTCIAVVISLGYILKPVQQTQPLPSVSQHDLTSIKGSVADIQKAVNPYTAKDSMGKREVIRDFENSVSDNDPTADREVRLAVEGRLGSGYLYVKASVDGKPLTGFDDVYVKLVDAVGADIGGHLIASKGLTTPSSESFTEMLFPLDDVKYKASYTMSQDEAVSGNFLAFLNEHGDSSVISFSSTARRGKIEELSVYFECADGPGTCMVDVLR